MHHTVDVAIPTMVEQGDGGAIVLTSSAAGLVGIGGDDAGSLGYTAAKHGVVGLMRAYANHLAPHRIRVNSIHPAAVSTPMINNEFTRQWLERITQESDAPVDFGMALPVQAVERRGHRERGGLAGVRRGLVHHRSDVAGRRGLRQQALMARNPAAQTAFGPMVQVAIEQYEPPERRLVDDDLAAVDPARRPTRDRSRDAVAAPAPPDDIGRRAGGARLVGAHRVPQALHR